MVKIEINGIIIYVEYEFKKREGPIPPEVILRNWELDDPLDAVDLPDDFLDQIIDEIYKIER